jgi:hypothetical protein
MTEIIEPNPLLVEYFNKVQYLKSSVKVDLDKFDSDGEWQYVESNIERNIFLLKRLEEAGLLPSEVNACDCGVGFGTVLYDLYLQSKEFNNRQFTFTGIEKCDEYVNSLKSELLSYWDNNLNLIHDDIMSYDYSNTNFIWFFTPFKISNKLMSFFDKIITEIPVGGFIFGLDQYRVMEYGSPELIEKFNELEFNHIDDLIFYRKTK